MPAVPGSAARTWRRKVTPMTRATTAMTATTTTRVRWVPVRLMDVASAARATRSRLLMHPPDEGQAVRALWMCADPNTSTTVPTPGRDVHHKPDGPGAWPTL